MTAPVDLAPEVLTALAAKQGEILDPRDTFWPNIVATVIARRDVNEVLQARIRTSFPGNRDAYLRLTQQLPALADILAQTLVFDSAGTVSGKPVDEVLRRMRVAPPAAQHALITRATDTSNVASAELVTRVASYPQILAGLEHDVDRLRSSSNPKARNLALRYLLSRDQDISDQELSELLMSADPSSVRAVLGRLSSLDPGRLASLEPILTKLSETSLEIAAWADVLRILIQIHPHVVTRFIDQHSADRVFWLGDRGFAVIDAVATVPVALAIVRQRIAEIPLQEMLATGRCETVVPAIELLSPSYAPADVATVLTRLLSTIAGAARGSACSVERIAPLLDSVTSRLGGEAAKTYAASLTNEVESYVRATNENAAGITIVKNLLQSAFFTRNAFASDPKQLAGFAARADVHPLVAAIVQSLPSDHVVLTELRRVLTPGTSESLTDYLVRNRKIVLTVLRLTSRADGWASQDVAQLGVLSTAESDVDVARAAFDALMATGNVAGLTEIFDSMARRLPDPAGAPDERVVRAIRAFTRAAHNAPDKSGLYGPQRLNWLLERLSVEGLRGPIVRALGRRPETLAIEPRYLSAWLAQAVPSRRGSTIAICADAATLGPFMDNGLAFQMLEAATNESYQSEEWSPACVAWLAGSTSAGLTEAGQMLWLLSLRDGKLATEEDPATQLQTLSGLWSASKQRSLGDLSRRRIIARAGALVPRMGWSLTDVNSLKHWDSELSRDYPDQVWPFRKEWLLRSAYLLALAIPAAALLHLAFWSVLLLAYRTSVRVQTHVFYNPLTRKILGFGYVDILLVWIGPLRRTLFAPFVDAMSGDIGQIFFGAKEAPYYAKSLVVRLDRAELARGLREAEREALSGGLDAAARPITSGLASWKGPTCLFGPSGRGKTSYLRHVLATNPQQRSPFVYLRAAQCGSDIVSAICARFPGLGRDTDLIVSLIRSGLLDIYIDGLNEVDRELQERIVRFVVDFPTANIFVTSQEVGVSLPSKLATYYLLPLTKAQMEEFLLGREPALDASAPLRGKFYRERVEAFLQELADEVMEPVAGAEPAQGALVTSFLATLANPMDLETAATLLSLDIDPDPFRLQEQQFRLVDEDCQDKLKRRFPIVGFSNAALAAREQGKAEIDWTSFAEYVAILEQRKQVKRTNVEVASGKEVVEYRFRHDKVADFYLHFALLGPEPAKRFAMAGDDRFAGVFDYLARKLPPEAANELKEYLLSRALDSNDHRLSDRFLQHLRWRSLLTCDAPDWLIRYDLPESVKALREFDRLAEIRDGTEAQMRVARTVIENSRLASRLLVAKDAETLENAVRDLFLKKGASEKPTAGGTVSVFDVPDLGAVAVICVAGPRATSTITRVGVTSRASQVTEGKLVIINPQPELDPAERDWSQVEEWERPLIRNGIAVLQTRDLYRWVRADEESSERNLWTRIAQVMGDNALIASQEDA
ncbi:hypothetical protein HL666_20100 [Bradyrhizobium sp. 83002]|uniref:hypothetical protein n=1 Tax=Bradyrhizobium aeschynomenes TaxID=2734909 RepID=UPI00155442E1|nr:hypothetical protein [Bradyrhizobium aeschynomenes]NPU13076.1 hypothetical protein [Bradyrhizobium aeschynomenes]